MAYYNVSRKDIINQPTPIPERSYTDLFCSPDNVFLLTKVIYQLHRQNNGRSGYLEFKTIVPARVDQWVQQYDIDNFQEMTPATRNVKYLNARFMRDNRDLFECDGLSNPHDTTVYIGYSLDRQGRMQGAHKKYSQLTAQDIENLDVFEPQATYIKGGNHRFDYDPASWGYSSKNRHYDRNNEGFAHRDAERASLVNPVRGYNMSKYIAAIEESKKKNATRQSE